MDLKEQNWKNFTANHFARLVRDLDKIFPKEGNRIVSKSQKLSEQSRADRNQTNRSMYADGRRLEQSWEYNQLSDQA